MTPHITLSHLRRALLTLGVTQVINWGALYYTLAMIGPRISAETGWSPTFVSSGFTVAMITMGLVSPFAGKTVDQHGGAWVMAIGSVIGALGLALLGLAHTPAVYLLAWAIIGLAMGTCLYDSAFASLSQVAGNETRKAISLLTLVAGFASTVFWPLTLFALSYFDWRTVMLAYAATILIVCAPLHLVGLRKHRPSPEQSAAPETPPAEMPPHSPPAIPEKTALILFALVLAGHGFVANAMSVHFISLFSGLGVSEHDAVLAGALIGPGQVGARLVELLFGRRLNPLFLGLVAVILLPISFVIPLAFGASAGVAMTFGLVYGASNGLMTIARGVVPHALFGPVGYGRRLGLISAPTMIVKAASPAIFAWMMHVTGPNGAMIGAVILGIFASSAMIALALLAFRAARTPPAP